MALLRLSTSTQTSPIGFVIVLSFYTMSWSRVGKYTVSGTWIWDEVKPNLLVLGITTGFGGSADTRTGCLGALQVALLQMQLSGTLPVHNEDRHPGSTIFDRAIPNGDALAMLSMPEAWVRAAMLIRCNSLLRGHSGVRLSVIENMLALLRKDCVPLVPLRGSISASGDLSPLSYIAGALEGNPDVRVWIGNRESRKLVPADEALAQFGLDAVVYGPKEGLGVLNGTAVSAAVAGLALHEVNHLAVLSQVLTAIGVEALKGTVKSFDPFIAKVRPHPGQIEVAQNISCFVQGSQLARAGDECDNGQLCQDRYALRTASQWLGPQLEDLVLAHKQLERELNSTTDNPLIDVSAREVHHGGNFQAAVVTSSTEKTRLALQMLGKIIFAQSTELLDIHLNNGLPPNLAVDEPSLSYTLKGVDINMAAYMSELAFLANPVSSHVQSAEMSNQAINSLALVSARYTHMALDVLSLMSSAYLYSLCQALDLRVMHAQFIRQLRPALEEVTAETFGAILPPPQLEALHQLVWVATTRALSDTTNKDSSDRFIAVAKSVQPLLLDALQAIKQGSMNDSTAPLSITMCQLSILTTWTDRVAAMSKDLFVANRARYIACPDATAYLGSASKRLYKFVREDLKVPLHRGLCDHPLPKSEQSDRKPANTGSRISVIYEALRTGRLMVPVMECLVEAQSVCEL
ncbi:MAG: hypothetical protein M1839_000011 [Geoglossum umbratile]|nr:MAG: hypothetical protein M1839_000011 [Geoglossum umbratile]